MRSAFSLLLILFAVQIVSAQDDIPDNPLFPKPRPKRVFVGPLFGYNSNFHSGGFKTLSGAQIGNADCGSFSTGGGNGILAGLAGEYWFKPGGPTALQVRVYYEQKPGNFTTEDAPMTLIDSNGNPQSFVRAWKVSAKYNLLNLEVQYKYNFPGTRFGVAVGPKIGFLLNSVYTQSQSLTAGFVFDSAQKQNTIVLVPEEEIPGASTIRFGLIAHLQYEFLLGPFLVTPRVFYDLGVTHIVSGWSVSSLGASIEIKYGF